MAATWYSAGFMFRPARTHLCNEAVGRKGECWEIRALKWGFHPFLSIYPRFSPSGIILSILPKLHECRKGRKVTADQRETSTAGESFQVWPTQNLGSNAAKRLLLVGGGAQPQRRCVCASAPMGVAAPVPSLCGQLRTLNQAIEEQRSGNGLFLSAWIWKQRVVLMRGEGFRPKKDIRESIKMQVCTKFFLKTAHFCDVKTAVQTRTLQENFPGKDLRQKIIKPPKTVLLSQSQHERDHAQTHIIP